MGILPAVQMAFLVPSIGKEEGGQVQNLDPVRAKQVVERLMMYVETRRRLRIERDARWKFVRVDDALRRDRHDHELDACLAQLIAHV